jgi:hypothetical protein
MKYICLIYKKILFDEVNEQVANSLNYKSLYKEFEQKKKREREINMIVTKVDLT